MRHIVEIKRRSEQIIIKPTQFKFHTDDTEVMGFVAFDITGARAFNYPVFSNPDKNPIQYLREIILSGKTEFKEMMRLAYENKRSVMIGQHEVLWGEYESLFAKQSFYTGKPNEAEIVKT